MRCKLSFATLWFVILALLVPSFPALAAPSAQSKKGEPHPIQVADIAYTSIPGSPLHINIYTDGSVGLLNNGVIQFYAERASGVFLWAGNDTWGPRVPYGNPMSGYSLVEQGNLQGSGTVANPYRVQSIFDVGSTGLRLNQVVKYVNGSRDVSFEWTIHNSGTQQGATLFHAADLYVDGNDAGAGYFDINNRTVGGFNLDSRLYGLFTPITPAEAYEEAGYSTIWSRIGRSGQRGSGFFDRTVDAYIDNGAGLQWKIPELARGSSFTIRDRFSVTPVPTSGSTNLELPPILGRNDFLPSVREFEFGTQVSHSNTHYGSNNISFDIPISRYYGASNNIAPTAYLTLRAFDVDSPSESDLVKVGNCQVGKLTGINNSWQEVTLSFPSSCLSFPAPAISNYTDSTYDKTSIPLTARMTPSQNRVSILVDTQQRGYKTIVAWAKLYVGGVRPVLFSHGLDPFCSNGADRGLGDKSTHKEWKTFLSSDGIPALGNLNDGAMPLTTQVNQMALTYSEMRRLFGLRRKGADVAETDKIIIVGHSMGGLTGRSFIHTYGSDVVANFATFGTPNNGALSARAPVPCSYLARDDLRVPYVRDVFNPSHNLSYTWETTSQHMSSIAGRVDTSDNNDGWVSHSSTRALPYDRDVFYTFNTDKYSGESVSWWMHTSMPSFKSTYDLVKREGRIGTIIDRPSRTGSFGAATGSHPSVPGTSQENTNDPHVIQSSALTLDPGSTTSVTFPVDTASTLATLIESDRAEGLSYSLRAPSGTIYTPAAGELAIQNPEVGTWTATFAASSAASQAIHLTFAAVATSSMTLYETATPFYIRTGETGTFSVSIQENSAPIPGLSVTGTLLSPAGSTSAVTLAEDGSNPGTYQLSYPASLSGTYSLDVHIGGARLDGTPFRRETTLVATSIPGSLLDPMGADITWDTADLNTDGLTDVLSATLHVHVPESGTYRLEGALGTVAEPSQFGTSQTLDLDSGTHIVTVAFDGQALGRLATAHHYGLQQVRLLGDDGQVLDWTKQFNNLYYINPALFQHRLLDATVVSATPVDSNGDTRSDQLAFTSIITTTRGGNYKLQATLADSNGQPFTFAEHGLSLGQGSNSVQLTFDGAAIAANGVSGVFTLSDLIVTPLDPAFGDQELHSINSFQTDPLNIGDFARQVQLSVTSNMASTSGYVQITPASPDGKYLQGTPVEMRPVFLALPPISWSWSVDGGAEIADPTLNLTMHTDHTVRLTAVFPSSETPTGTITPSNGGTVTTSDGSFQIEFPSNAVTTTTIVTYTNLNTSPHPLPPSSRALRKFTLEARTSDGQPVNQFQQPYTMQLSYTDAQLAVIDVPEASLDVMYWDGHAWVSMLPCERCSVDVVNNNITIVADHFTEFVLTGIVEPEQQKVFLPLVKP